MRRKEALVVSEGDLVRFVYREARLLDEKRFDEWLELFTEDGFYWVPLAPGQTDPVNHASLAYEDRFLLKLRVERLKSPHAYSQQPPSRCHHLLQAPEVEKMDDAEKEYLLRTQFIYTEAQGDEMRSFSGTVFHSLAVVSGKLRMRLKRVNLLNSDAALPSIHLFI
ncbi:MAG: aromatic-ring-hydroxylating dioxygenase subunit beta [Burkholderiales bacterium]